MWCVHINNILLRFIIRWGEWWCGSKKIVYQVFLSVCVHYYVICVTASDLGCTLLWWWWDEVWRVRVGWSWWYRPCNTILSWASQCSHFFLKEKKEIYITSMKKKKREWIIKMCIFFLFLGAKILCIFVWVKKKDWIQLKIWKNRM